jgi:hypothetical protein
MIGRQPERADVQNEPSLARTGFSLRDARERSGAERAETVQNRAYVEDGPQ